MARPDSEVAHITKFPDGNARPVIFDHSLLHLAHNLSPDAFPYRGLRAVGIQSAI
jgi:hypothetical protein